LLQELDPSQTIILSAGYQQTSNMKPSPFLDFLLPLIKSNDHILDLGAGDGKLDETFASMGAIVTALDKVEPPLDLDEKVTWIKADLKTYNLQDLPDNNQLILCKQFIQFFDKDFILKELHPILIQKLAPGGILAIETFSAPPEPAFSKSHHTYFHLTDFAPLTTGMESILSQEISKKSTDRSGTPRKFHVTQLIVRKK